MTQIRDTYSLQRFVDAQNPVYERVCAELRQGQKRSHWMWFIFPQLQGLGYSDLAIKYGISCKHEADEYLNHSVLGPRLVECTNLVISVEGRSIQQIFGYPDDLKFHSSMTLFANTTTPNPIFKIALNKHFAGELDQITMKKL